MSEIVLMCDAQVADIPVEECGEALVDVATLGFARVDRRRADSAGDWLILRSGVAARLAHAASLLPDGLHLLHVEGYRPSHLQAHYFTSYRDQLAAARPELDPGDLHRLTSRYVSPPEIAPHSAGAAVDLTLCAADGTELDMGTAVDANPEESDGGCYTAAPVGWAARANREILIAALAGAGLVNYPTEWWHWSYGDRYWALHTGHRSAIYGPVSRACTRL